MLWIQAKAQGLKQVTQSYQRREFEALGYNYITTKF